MRQREERDLSVEARRELEALDRALAGEPVDAEHDAVARLAREMRAMRPTPGEEFAARLDERAAAGFAPEGGAPASPFALRAREWLAGARPMRLLAPAGAVATVLVVASVAVIRGGDGGDAPVQPTTGTLAGPTQPQDTDQGGSAAERDAQREAAGDGESAGTLSAPAEPDVMPEVPPVPPVPPPGRDPERIAPGAERKVEHSATLSLSTDGDEFEDVTDGVVEITDRYRGFVISSQESASGDSSRATFDLEIPSDRLSAALADLSELAHVEARTEDALDITAPTVTARQGLTDARAEADSLLRQLAEADTPRETEAIRRRLEIARSEVAAARQEVRRLARRANYSDVRVTVTSDGGSDGDWGVDDAVDDIGDALSTAGGVALISAAILLPIAVIVALVALVWRRSVRRGRERALGE